MKTVARPERVGVRLSFATRKPPSNIAPLSFTCPNFKDGRSITYTLTREGYVFQLQGDKAVRADTSSYPLAASKARRLYGVPAIGEQSHGMGVAA